MAVKPLSFDEASLLKSERLPDSVIESVNELIIKNFSSSGFTILQDDLIDLILSKDSSLNRSKIFDEHLLDFEPVFKKEGWLIVYEKPSVDERFNAYFKFKKA